ncbi:alpha-amylase family glycosyl hydrolase [Mycoplasma sp. 1781]
MVNLGKKIILYELKVENFVDTNGSNFGDFKGVMSKLEYFKNLSVNVICFEDILKLYENRFDLGLIKKRYGSIKDFARLVETFKNNQIEVAPIINLKEVRQAFVNWNNMMSLYNLNYYESNRYLTKLDTYLINKEFEKTSLYELSDFIKYFESVLGFYLQLNVSTVILDNFEFLAFEGLKEEEKLKFINDLYKIIKRKNSNINVIFKTSNNNFNLYKKMLMVDNKCLDYLYLTWMSVIGNNDALKKHFKNKMSFKSLYRFVANFKNHSNVILSFGSDLSGRFFSKWANEKAYLNESTKSFFVFLYSGNHSIGFYYGDEIGVLRAKFNQRFTFNNEDYNEEKRFLQYKNISLNEYHKYNCYFNKWSSYIQMPWNGQKIKSNENTNIFYPINLESNNVEEQIINKDSTINFVYFLNKLSLNSKFSSYFIKGVWNIKQSHGIFKFSKKLNEQRMVLITNLTSKHQKITPLYGYKILASSYANKFYSEIPKELNPFEALILYKTKNN